MKKNVSGLLYLFICVMISYGFSGRAVINDPDGYVNLRKGKSSTDSIITKIREDEWFHYELDCNSDWWKVMTQEGKRGFVHKSRIRPLDNPHAGTKVYETERNGSKARIVIVESVFSCSGHNVEVDDKGYPLIDGRLPRGTAWTMPITEITRMAIEWNGKKIEVNKELYDGCFNPFFDDRNFHFAFSEDTKSLLAFLSASDGAGVYGVMWIFRNDGKNSRLFAGHGDCTMFNTWCHQEP